VDAGRVPPVSPTFRKTAKGPELPSGFLSDSDPFNLSGRQDSNLRPLAPEGEPRFSTGSTSVQGVGFVQGPSASRDAATRAGRSGTLGRVPPVSPNHHRALQVAPAEAPRLLTVREVAARLRTSTATVYALCDRGELPHARVSNAIRIRPENLDAYLRKK
jgi:excisionase family DNA binding protein